MRKILTIVPILLTLLIVVSFQVVFLTNHQFLPYPEPFGREHDASLSKIKHAVEVPANDTFAYPSLDNLNYVKLPNDGSTQMEQRPFPDAEWKDLYDYQLIYLIHYKDGKADSVLRASGARGAALQSVTFSDRWNHQWVVWLDALDYDRYQVLYTNDNPVFRSQQNRLTWSDYNWSLQTTPLFLGFSLFLLLYAFKWAPVSYLYLIATRFRNENHFFDRTAIHVRIASAVYLFAKLLFVNDLYKSYVIPFMPTWMLPTVMHYLLMIVIFLYAWGKTANSFHGSNLILVKPLILFEIAGYPVSMFHRLYHLLKRESLLQCQFSLLSLHIRKDHIAFPPLL